MPEPRKQRLDCYVYLPDLIESVALGVEWDAASVGTYYAEKLERAAKAIRDANAARDAKTKKEMVR